MKKIIFKLIILMTISIIISCSNENSGTKKENIQLSENERLEIFDIRYLTSENGEYLNILLHSNIYRKKISILGQGFTRVNISKNKLMKIKVLIPSYKKQLEIVDVINIENNKILLEESKLYKLQKLKKGLMQNMFVAV